MSPGVPFVIATGNPGKLAEMRALLAPTGRRVMGLGDAAHGAPRGAVKFPPEGDDYASNAVAKARAVALALGLPALADDSGLEVDALGGDPGPRSARYGGPGLDDRGRVAHLLQALRGVPEALRSARFVCVVALVTPEGVVHTARGCCEGRILAEARGGGGFGYDPVFAPEGRDLSMAELPAAEKNALSHRGRAVTALLAGLAAEG